MPSVVLGEAVTLAGSLQVPVTTSGLQGLVASACSCKLCWPTRVVP